MIARTVAALIASSAPVLAQSPQWAEVAAYSLPGTGTFDPLDGALDVGDINLDGFADVVVLAPGSQGLFVLLGSANGSLVSTPATPIGGGMNLSLGRLDADGLPDMIRGGSGGVLFTGTGTGMFGYGPSIVGVPGFQRGCTIGDFDGDGRLDVAFGSFNGGGGEIRIALALPTGGFALPSLFNVCSNPDYLTAADLDGDGRVDVVAACDTAISVVWNLATGFVPQSYGRGGGGHIAVGDFTGDGLSDMVTGTGRLIVGLGSHTFVAGVLLPMVDQSWAEAFDCDGDGVLDVALSSNAPTYGVLIARNLGGGAFDTSTRVPINNGPRCIRAANIVGDGRPELVVLSRDPVGNGYGVRVLRNLAPDCNYNGIDDPVELANGWAADCDGNGVPDSCQTDCDNSGTPDVCQIAAQPSLDLNSNGMLDSCEPAGTPYCFGDGTGAACPCDPGQAGPAGGGCLNAGGNGGRLRAVGNAQISLDSVTMHASGMDAGSFGLLFQGTAQQAAGQGSPFGDGLLCVNGTITRLIVRLAATGSLDYGRAVSGDPALSTLGNVPVGGATLHYQVWYRDSAAFCTAFTYNLTNGVSVAWQP